jgi:hypothetical protein
MTVPARPKIYHITHYKNLPQLLSEGQIWSDAKRLALEIDCKLVGMSTIKRRRVEENEVTCRPGTRVGEFTPFNFCPRSVMLYILHKANNPDLEYRSGQSGMIHLQADFRSVVTWAEQKERLWALSDVNAGARYANYFCRTSDLDRIDWRAVESNDFRSPEVKERKQAEFLIYESLPWELIEKVGVIHERAANWVTRILADADHRPTVSVEPDWYF